MKTFHRVSLLSILFVVCACTVYAQVDEMAKTIAEQMAAALRAANAGGQDDDLAPLGDDLDDLAPLDDPPKPKPPIDDDDLDWDEAGPLADY